MCRLRRFLTGTSGAAAVEFAIVSPLLVVLLGGMVSIGLQALAQGRLNEAVRKTAEAALFTQDEDALDRVLVEALVDAGWTEEEIDDSDLVRLCDPDESDDAPCQDPPDYLIIDVVVPFNSLFVGRDELQSTMEVQIR